MDEKTNTDSLQVLILGNSHNYYGINPQWMKKKAFNLANTSQTIFYDEIFLHRYVNKCPNLKYVVCEIAYFSPYEKRYGDKSEWYRIMYYQIYMNCRFHSFFSKYNWELAYNRFSREKIKIAWHLKHKKLDCNEYGFGLNHSIEYRKAYNDSADAKNRVDVNTFQPNEYDYVLATNTLLSMAKICKDNNAKMLLITTPVTPLFYYFTNKQQLNTMYNMANEVMKQYPQTVIFKDFMRDDRFNEKDFYDADHLNKEFGAKKFTKIIENCVE